MNRYILMLIALLILFFSCRKNEDIIQVDVDIPDPEEVVAVDALGVVTDENGNALSQTHVKRYDEDGKLIGETTSDSDGRFTIRVPQESGARLLFFAKKKNYHPAARRLSPATADLNDVHLLMASEEAFPKSSSINPTDRSLSAVTSASERPARGVGCSWSKSAGRPAQGQLSFSGVQHEQGDGE